jgi:hypothetical protein
MASPLAEVVQGYSELASFLVKRWTEHASNVAERLDKGAYDADSAAADLAKCVSLTAETGFLLASEALDAAAILSGGQRQPHLVDSVAFSSPLPGAALALEGQLANSLDTDRLPTAVVTIRPAQLAAAAAEFTLRADASGHDAGTYWGKVRARTAAAEGLVKVWITVP